MRAFRVSLFTALLLLVASVAGATTVTVPNFFVNGTVIDANQMNANFSALTTWANGNVDHTNVGSGGIFASQIIPDSTAHATFGGAIAYTFPNPVIFSTNITQSAGTAALQTVTATSIVDSGTAQATTGGVTSYLGPVYTHAGAAVGSTFHWVIDIYSAANASCLNGAYCIAGDAVTLSSAAAFTSISTFSCDANDPDGTQAGTVFVNAVPNGAGLIRIWYLNKTGGTITGPNERVAYSCHGT